MPTPGVFTLTCPGSAVVTAITFASYGTPTGSCDAFEVDSTCNASSSLSVVQSACLGLHSCTITNFDTAFGDPCAGVSKLLDVEATCSAGSPTTGSSSSSASATGSSGSSSSGGSSGSSGGSTGGASGFGVLPNGLRDRTLWPFASDSIWNTPIGSGATLVAAPITNTGSTVIYQDPDLIVMTPTAPLTNLDQSGAGWGGDRCTTTTDVVDSLPIPTNFTVDSNAYNSCIAVLRPDGRTVAQSNAFARCGAGSDATCFTNSFDDVDLYGPGITGSHGGSTLSALGGTIRYGEFTSGAIHHALKIAVDAHRYFYCPSTPCQPVWPATTVDSYANQQTYGGTNPYVTQGALLTLDASFDVSALQTVPGRILGQAVKDYGIYIVDDTTGDSWVLESEGGPNGYVIDEFNSLYGYSIGTFAAPPGAPFLSDMEAVYGALKVVTNNGPTNIGGGGTPRAPLAPAIGN